MVCDSRRRRRRRLVQVLQYKRRTWSELCYNALLIHFLIVLYFYPREIIIYTCTILLFNHQEPTLQKPHRLLFYSYLFKQQRGTKKND